MLFIGVKQQIFFAVLKCLGTNSFDRLRRQIRRQILKTSAQTSHHFCSPVLTDISPFNFTFLYYKITKIMIKFTIGCMYAYGVTRFMSCRYLLGSFYSVIIAL